MNYNQLLSEVVEDDNITDLHLTVHSRPFIRKNGRFRPHPDYKRRLVSDDVEEVLESIIPTHLEDEFASRGEADFSYSRPGVSRFRVNAYHQRGSLCIAMRIIPDSTPDIDELDLPRVLKSLASRKRGLILSTGPTGSGKSTTQAAIINEINQTREAHVITLEDPIEYLHKHDKSLIHQREIGGDTSSFAQGLRSALRQDIDVLLVGEIRDRETIRIVLEAAETGHLVLATLHTSSAPAAIDRIVDIFPPEQRTQVRMQLSMVLSGVLAQQLVRRSDREGLIAAFEIMIANAAVRNIIREGKTSQLDSIIQTGSKYDMIGMDNFLLDLFFSGIISRERVLRSSHDIKYVQDGLKF